MTIEAHVGDVFGYQILVADSFASLLDGSGVPVDPPRFRELLIDNGCVLLQARGGAGKSTIAQRMIRLFADEGDGYALVSAKTLDPSNSPRSWGLRNWVTASEARGGEPLSRGGLLVVDGLNETPRSLIDDVLVGLDSLLAGHPRLAILITDRLARRDGVSRFWKHATLSPVPPDEVRRRTSLADPAEALSIPFYLDRFSAGAFRPIDILFESIRRFVVGDALNRLAAASYTSYYKSGRRVLISSLAAEAVDQDAWQEMLQAGFVVETDRGEAQFEHHLLQDFLAGLHLATHRDLWGPEGFDVVTLRAASFDALSLAVASVMDARVAEDFVKRVYDWNLYAAAYLLEEGREGSLSVDTSVRVALLASIAEKRFDSTLPTVQRVTDALLLQGDQLSLELLRAADHTAVRAIVRRELNPPLQGWVDEWFGRFTRDDRELATIEDTDALESLEPMLGWGAANALRRLEWDPETARRVVQRLTSAGPATVRWRAAHALGRQPSPQATAALLDALTQETDLWVKYGALRALLEHAYLLGWEDREALVARLVEIHTWVESPQLRTEAARCLDVRPLPSGWHRSVEPILDRILSVADSDEAGRLAELAHALRERKAQSGA